MKAMNRKHVYHLANHLLLPGIFALLLTACGGGGGGGDPTTDPVSYTIQYTTNHSVYLDNGIDTAALSGDIDGFFTSAGTNSLTRSSTNDLRAADGIQSKSSHTSISDVTGFIAERPAFNGETDSGQVLDGFETLIRLDTATVTSLTSTGRQSFPTLGATVSAYNLTLSNTMQPTDVANSLVQYLGVTSQTGTVTGLPTASANEPFETDYTLLISVVFYSQTDIVVSVVLVPTNLAGTYSAITSGISSPTNVGQSGATHTSKTDSFTAVGGGGLADFLFVIDNSGSMAGDQAAVSAAATAFGIAINSSGLDYQIGIITTDSDVLIDGLADGAFTTSITEFSTDVVVGTRGSSTETGIWFSEQSLQSIALGDSSDGTVTTEGHPRGGASLSIIILSDERSQYTSRSGNVAFDTANNLFIDRGYRVYAMIEPGDTNSQYSDLALATGGSVADIADQSVFSTIMSNIATNAGGASSQFILTETAIASTISITIDGASVANSSVDGWTYNAASISVVFHGTALPTGGEAVVVSYVYFN